MEKAFDRARIAPFHGGIGHAGNRFIKIERGAGDPKQPQGAHKNPIVIPVPGLGGKPGKYAQGSQRQHIASHSQAVSGTATKKAKESEQRAITTKVVDGPFGPHGEPAIADNGDDADYMKNQEHHDSGVQHRDEARGLSDHAGDIQAAVTEQEMSAKLRAARR